MKGGWAWVWKFRCEMLPAPLGRFQAAHFKGKRRLSICNMFATGE